jgi:hypothetical protein
MYGPEQQQQQQQQQQRQDAYRRGFGAKVALPCTEVLQEVLVGHDATLKLRAYHLGMSSHSASCIHRCGTVCQRLMTAVRVHHCRLSLCNGRMIA